MGSRGDESKLYCSRLDNLTGERVEVVTRFRMVAILNFYSKNFYKILSLQEGFFGEYHAPTMLIGE